MEKSLVVKHLPSMLETLGPQKGGPPLVHGKKEKKGEERGKGGRKGRREEEREGERKRRRKSVI